MSAVMRRRIPLACSTTLLAIALLAAGATGYRMNRHAAFVAGTRWSGGVIWGEVLAGLALMPLAAYFWRTGLRELRRPRA